jgi:hypothetical protein
VEVEQERRVLVVVVGLRDGEQVSALHTVDQQRFAYGSRSRWPSRTLPTSPRASSSTLWSVAVASRRLRGRHASRTMREQRRRDQRRDRHPPLDEKATALTR